MALGSGKRVQRNGMFLARFWGVTGRRSRLVFWQNHLSTIASLFFTNTRTHYALAAEVVASSLPLYGPGGSSPSKCDRSRRRRSTPAGPPQREFRRALRYVFAMCEGTSPPDCRSPWNPVKEGSRGDFTPESMIRLWDPPCSHSGANNFLSVNSPKSGRDILALFCVCADSLGCEIRSKIHRILPT